MSVKTMGGLLANEISKPFGEPRTALWYACGSVFSQKAANEKAILPARHRRESDDVRKIMIEIINPSAQFGR